MRKDIAVNGPRAAITVTYVDEDPVVEVDLANPDDQTVSCIECPRADVAYLMINHGRYWLCPDCDSDHRRDEAEK